MPHIRTFPGILVNARNLRACQTDAEQKLWRALRAHQLNNIHFRRQHAIGPYIADFCSPRHKIIIELDGGQHLDQQAYDDERTRFLMAKGYRVLRFWNHDVLNHLDDVLLAILQAVEEKNS